MISIRATLRRRFLAGLIVVVPIIITLLVFTWFFRLVDGLLSPVFNTILGYHVSGLGFISAVVIVFIVGFISTNVIGRRMISFLERLFLKIPLFKGIYTGLKQLADAFSPDNTASFKKFVIVEYPKPRTYAFGFLTKECTVAPEPGKETLLKAVYIPTNNLYLGEVILFRPEDVLYTEIPIDEGIKIIMSGGIAAPLQIAGERT